ncbi:MAG: glycosyl transferase [Candidatus Tectimicrobiota bacterium]|nr:MAG: glycosyl transferase [Candidatus Tectomicrobia bacterium]
MHVEILTTPAAFETLRREWLELLRQLPTASVFLTPQWQATWWHHFGEGYRLCVVVLRGADGRLHGLAPLMLALEDHGGGTLTPIGDLEVCDYFDVLLAPEGRHETATALVCALATTVGDTFTLSLPNLPPQSPTPKVLQTALLAQGLHVTLEPIETCPTVALPRDWETYLQSLRGKDRHELRRKLRRAAATARLETYITREASRLDGDLDTFFALHRMSRDAAKRGFMTTAKEAFFRDLAHALWPEGWLELVFLLADGEPIASLWCLPFGTTYAVYNSGYHPGYAQLSAGIVLFAECIRSAIARGFQAFDFLRGSEAYKYRFGATDRPLLHLLARTPCPVSEPCV